MAGRSQEIANRGFQLDRENGADYYHGLPEEGSDSREEVTAPYKLEPSPTEIEDFLTRLRQEGL